MKTCSELLEATTAPDMDYPNVKVFLVIVLLEAIIGLLSNVFMIVCLSIKDFQRKNMIIYRRILIPLNVTSICYTVMLSMNYIISLLWPELYRKMYMYYTLMYMTLYSITSYMWLTAGLCVFYFMKIVPSQPGVLTTLQSRIGAIVWCLIIMAEVVSLGGSFLSMFISNPYTKQRNSSLAMSELIEEINAQSVKFMDIILILNWLPFLTILVTTIGSACFLKRYNYQIQKSMTTSGNTRVRDYQAAIQTMMGLLSLYISILLFNILLQVNVFSYLSLGYWVCVTFIFSFAILLPVILINGNPKLKEAFKQMMTL